MSVAMWRQGVVGAWKFSINPKGTMMKIQSLLLCVVAASGAAFAQTPAPKDPMATPRIDQRQANQERRIEQGVASGQLTPRVWKKVSSVSKTPKPAPRPMGR